MNEPPEPDIMTAFAKFDAHEIVETDPRHADDCSSGEVGGLLRRVISERVDAGQERVLALSGIVGLDDEEVRRSVTELPTGLDASYTKYLQ